MLRGRRPTVRAICWRGRHIRTIVLARSLRDTQALPGMPRARGDGCQEARRRAHEESTARGEQQKEKKSSRAPISSGTHFLSGFVERCQKIQNKNTTHSLTLVCVCGGGTAAQTALRRCLRLLRRVACCSLRWRKPRLVAHQGLMLCRDVRRMRPGGEGACVTTLLEMPFGAQR